MTDINTIKYFYLTDNIELAREWAVCNPSGANGWVHKFYLEGTIKVKVLDFEDLGIYAWIAELMKHRDADNSRRYKVLAPKFIDKYGIDTDDFDIIRGWRANALFLYY